MHELALCDAMLKKVRDWHAGSYETMPIKVAEGVVKRAGSIVKKAVLK